MAKKINSSNNIHANLLDERCVVNTVMKIIGKRWMAEIIFLIENKINRFSTMKQELSGVSDQVLHTHLSLLHHYNVVEKVIHQQIPLKVEYSLTASGQALANHLHALCAWGKVNIENMH